MHWEWVRVKVLLLEAADGYTAARVAEIVSPVVEQVEDSAVV